MKASTRNKMYRTPKGTVMAKTLQEAATKKQVPVESVYVISFTSAGIPDRCKAYYN